MSEGRELRALLSRFRRRWTASAWLSLAGGACAIASVPLAAGASAVWLTGVTGAPLVAVAAVGLIASTLAAGMFLATRWRRPDDRQVARFIEERAVGADLRDSLSTAVEIAAQPGEPGPFAPMVVRQAVEHLREIRPDEVVPSRMLRRGALRAAAGMLLLALTAAAAWPHLQRALATAWIAWFPGAVDIVVLTGDARIPAGRPVTIAARLNGRAATLLDLPPTLIVDARGDRRSVTMTAADGGYEHRLESVDSSFDYRIAAGTAMSPTHRITALFPPRVTRIDLHYTYPRFTGLSPRREEDGGDIHAPAGTRVRLEIHTDKPIVRGTLTMGSGASAPLGGPGGSGAVAELVVEQEDGYRVRLEDADGLSSAGDVEYFIRVVDDRPPNVRIVRPSGDQGITPLEEVAIEARADDDHGLTAFDLIYTVAGRPPRTVPFERVSGTPIERAGTYVLSAEDLGVQPGDVIAVYARTRDVPRGRPSSEARSEIFFLEVKPFHEEFVSAESQGMGGGSSTQVDGLVAAQKEIISATWNLERRSGTGRSEEDLRAVARAQAELKGRLEQMLGSSRRGLRGTFPQQIRLSPQGRGRGVPDPAGAALDAMGRAVEQLEQLRTTDAIPHEMAALQALLQAQAEVRRRQVMMQQAMSGGGGGTSRADRDLSALFDRELQRQQRTSYETPPQPPQKDESPTGGVMDRVRELARRQGELARRQEELARSGETPAERQRQLERLTREQEELRRQLEELERDLRRQPAGERRAGAPQPQSGSESARQAAEAARRAADAMGRGDLSEATARGGRAADALRRLEQQLRGSSPEAQQRAAGDVQLEAQQIAEAQRRIASEAARAGRERASGGRDDERRRLAAEQGDLADRVDALERAAGELARELRGESGSRVTEAARQLRDRQIGGRMRDAARQLREGTAGGSQEPEPGQLARAMDAVVDALGGSGAAETRRITQGLDETRAVRERLDRLAERLREAEAAAGRTPDGGADLERARDAYAEEIQRGRGTVDRLQREQRGAAAGATPEQHEFSRSAPGHESFKQDFSRWDTLRRDLDTALERYESAMAAQLAARLTDDRLSGGGSEQIPEPYRALVSRYFESLAKTRK